MNSFYTLLMSTFYIFNFSSHQYLHIDDKGVSLSSTPSPITLTESNDGTGRLDDNQKKTWTLKNVDANTGLYVIGYQNKDAYATSFLYANDGSANNGTVACTYAEPSVVFSSGLWLVSTDDFDSQEIFLDEASASFSLPAIEKTFTKVSLTRKLYPNEWNTLCLPFSLSDEQVRNTWGEGTLVAGFSAFDSSSENMRISFKQQQGIEAGIPCIIKPAKVADDNNPYIFDWVQKSDWTTSDSPQLSIGDMTFFGSYLPKTVNAGSYVVSDNNSMIHLKRDTQMKGFRGFFSYLGTNKAKTLTWNLEEAHTPTGIGAVSGNHFSSPSPSDIYQVDGKMVRRKATTTQGLVPGVYIMNGMKIIVK